jgi:hypothetical protein
MPAAKVGDRYLMYVDWSEEDELCVSYCPDLFPGRGLSCREPLGGLRQAHGIVEHDPAQRAARGEPIPEPTARASLA